MLSKNKTVAEIVKQVRRECNSYPLPANAAEMLRLVREIKTAHEREIVRLGKENERLKAALNPVLDCELRIGDSRTEAVGEIGTSSKYGVCDEEGSDLWNEDIADNLNAVREAQMIFKESEHEITAGLVKENELLKQEIAAKDGERKGLIRANETLANDNTRLRGEIAGLREKMGDDDLLKMARDIEKMAREIAAKDAEIENLKKKIDEYERQPELMAETAREALQTLQDQDAEITELRECLKQACEVACDGCCLAVWNNQKFVKCKKHSNWKCPFGAERWRKALKGVK